MSLPCDQHATPSGRGGLTVNQFYNQVSTLVAPAQFMCTHHPVFKLFTENYNSRPHVSEPSPLSSFTTDIITNLIPDTLCSNFHSPDPMLELAQTVGAPLTTSIDTTLAASMSELVDQLLPLWSYDQHPQLSSISQAIMGSSHTSGAQVSYPLAGVDLSTVQEPWSYPAAILTPLPADHMGNPTMV